MGQGSVFPPSPNEDGRQRVVPHRRDGATEQSCKEPGGGQGVVVSRDCHVEHQADGTKGIKLDQSVVEPATAQFVVPVGGEVVEKKIARHGQQCRQPLCLEKLHVNVQEQEQGGEVNDDSRTADNGEGDELQREDAFGEQKDDRQKKVINEYFLKWKGNNKQTDDVLHVGFEV